MKYEMEVQVNSKLNVRDGPGMSYKVIGSLKNGDKITATESQDGWYHHETGWSSSQYLVLIKDDSGESATAQAADTGATEAKLNLSDEEKELLYSLYNTVDAKNAEKIDNFKFIFGAPMQFNDLCDPRPAESQLGRSYLEKVMGDMSLVTIIPGKADFMKGFSKDLTNEIAKDLVAGENHNPDEESSLEKILEGKEVGRYYSFSSDYTEYMKYVNNMCRLSSVLLGIGDQTYFEGSKKYKNFDWDIENLSPGNGGGSIFSFLKMEKSVSFFIDAKQTSFSDGMGNSLGESKIASTFGSGASDMVKEAQFLFGKSYSDKAVIDTSKHNYEAAVNKVINGLTKDQTLANQFADRASDHVTTLLNGGNIAFPEIYKESSYSKSINVEIKLISPYGDTESIYQYILVPLFHLIALSFPRQMGANGYVNPFLVRAFCKGWFNCSLGIIDSISIKRASQDGWSVNGLPTEVDVSISIKDLYENMTISRAGDYSTFHNIDFMDMISTWCGVNMNVPELTRKFNLYKAFTGNKITDIAPNIYEQFTENIRNKIQSFMK